MHVLPLNDGGRTGYSWGGGFLLAKVAGVTGNDKCHLCIIIRPTGFESASLGASNRSYALPGANLSNVELERGTNALLRSTGTLCLAKVSKTAPLKRFRNTDTKLNEVGPIRYLVDV